MRALCSYCVHFYYSRKAQPCLMDTAPRLQQMLTAALQKGILFSFYAILQINIFFLCWLNFVTIYPPLFWYSSYQDDVGSGNTNTAVSLTGLRKPKIDSWDSMGILGLTTKIWNDTKKRQETFLESTGHFLREETSSYIMWNVDNIAVF